MMLCIRLLLIPKSYCNGVIALMPVIAINDRRVHDSPTMLNCTCKKNKVDDAYKELKELHLDKLSTACGLE